MEHGVSASGSWPANTLRWRQGPEYTLEQLHELVDDAVCVRPKDRRYPGSQYLTGYYFADSPLVDEALHSPEVAHEMLTMIDRLLSVTAKNVKDKKDARDLRHRIGGLVYQQAGVIAELAEGDDETALLAQQIIFKTWGEREAGTLLYREQDRRWLAVLCPNLPAAVMACQNSSPESVSDENIERISHGLFRMSGTENAGWILAYLAETKADSDTQRVGTALMNKASSYFGDTVPDNMDELAYKIHVANLLIDLDRIDPLKQNIAKSMLTDLDNKGKNQGWNKFLWSKITSYVRNEVYSMEHRKAPASMLLERYGLDYDRLLVDWSVGSGLEQDDRRFVDHHNVNLRRIIDVETQCPGAVKKLNAPPYRIRNFARVPYEALVAQANALGKRRLSHALVGLGIYENPQESTSSSIAAHSPFGEMPLWQSLYDAARKHGITLFFHEGDAAQLTLSLGTSRRRYGKPAEFAVAKFHNGNAPHIGSGFASRHIPTQRDIADLARDKRLHRHLQGAIKRFGELVLIACHAGEDGNTAQTLHELLQRTVVGPDQATNGFVDDQVTLVRHRLGGCSLDFQYQSSDLAEVNALRYSNVSHLSKALAVAARIAARV